MAGKTYSIEYKIQAVKRVTEDGKSAAQVSRELGINVNTLREWLEDKYEHDFLSGKTTARKVCCICGYEYLSQSNSLKRNDIMSLASSPCTHCGETEATITYVGNVEDGDLVRDSLTHAITTNQIADCNLIAKYDDNNLVGHEYVLTRDVVSKYAKNK